MGLIFAHVGVYKPTYVGRDITYFSVINTIFSRNQNITVEWFILLLIWNVSEAVHSG
jgi:hypothetical protein